MNNHSILKLKRSFFKPIKLLIPPVFMLVLLSMICTDLSAAWNSKPILIRVSDAVKPGALININGEGLGGEHIYVAMIKDPGGNPSSVPPRGSLPLEIVQQDEHGHFIVVKFPDFAPAGVYSIWVSNNYGWSNPLRLNAPRVLFMSEYEAWPGQKIQIVGRNFDGTEFGADTNVLVRLSNAGSQYTQEVDSINPYCITFTVGGHPLENYKVELSNNGGISWESPSSGQTLTIRPTGNDPIGLGVAWADTFTWDQHDITLPPYNVPVSSGGDVTAAIQNAITTIKSTYGGGRINLRNGTYRITSLSLPENCILEGESMDSTQLIYIGTNQSMIRQDDVSKYTGRIGVHRLCLKLSNDFRPEEFISFWCNTTSAGFLFIVKVRIDYQYDTLPPEGSGRGHAAILFAKERAIIKDNHFAGWLATIHTGIDGYLHVHGNHFEYSNSHTNIMSKYSFVENNTVYGHKEFDAGYPSTTYSRQHGGLYLHPQTYAANNNVHNVGTYHGTDGEAILAEIPGKCYNYGKVTGSTATSLEVNTFSSGYPLVTPDNNSGSWYVVINQGTGLGQMKKVTTISGSVINIGSPWDINPDTTSMWTLISPNSEITVYRNNISNSTTGVSMYGNWYDGVVSENTIQDCLGILLPSRRNSLGECSFNFFNRITRNTISGLMPDKNAQGSQGGISITTGRLDIAHGYREVGNYATEIRDNTVSGDPARLPRYGAKDDACIYYNAGGLYNYQVDSTGDVTNIVVENNNISNETFGIQFSPCLYGAILCGNNFNEILNKNINIDARDENIIQSCGTPADKYYSVKIEIIDSVFGEPVKGLEVILNNLDYLTDSLGIISLPDLPEGSYDLSLGDKRFVITDQVILEIYSDSLFQVHVRQLPNYSVALEFADSASRELLEGLKVRIDTMNYIINNEGIILIPELREGYHLLVLEDDHFLLTGNGIIEVSSDSLFRVYVHKLPEYAVQIEFSESVSGEPIEELEVILETLNNSTDKQGRILIQLMQGVYQLVVPDSRFEIIGNGIIQIHSDTLIYISVKVTPLLNIKVINKATGLPVYRAVVNVDESSYFTNSSGLVSVGEYPFGTVKLAASHTDYFSVLDTMVLNRDTTFILTMTPKKANITFRVSDINGPLSGAKVILTGTQFTNTTGNVFFFLQPARVKYSYSVEKTGYSPVQDSVYVEVDTTLILLLEKTLSVNDLDYLDVTINPNPFDSYFNINTPENSRLNIYDISGLLRYSTMLDKGVNKIFPEDLEGGGYILKIVMGKSVFTKLIIKQE